MWWIQKPHLDVSTLTLRPGMIIPVLDPRSIIVICADRPAWEDARELLEDGDWL